MRLTTKMQLKSIGGIGCKYLSGNNLLFNAMDQTDPWQVVPRQVFIPYNCLLICCSLSHWLSRGMQCEVVPRKKVPIHCKHIFK